MRRRERWYVGVDGLSRVAFRWDRVPSPGDPAGFQAVIGPFDTRRGAQFMALYGGNNPHLRTADDAERHAKAAGEMAR